MCPGPVSASLEGAAMAGLGRVALLLPEAEWDRCRRPHPPTPAEVTLGHSHGQRPGARSQGEWDLAAGIVPSPSRLEPAPGFL